MCARRFARGRSIRAVNWLAALSGFQEGLRQDDGFRRRLVSSLCGQMQVLSGDLETDVRGNHLLANLRALILFGLACPEERPACWHRQALVTLEEELEEQVLADGGHFERSPAYHLIVLEHCLEIAVALVRNGRTPPPRLDDAVRRMLAYLAGILPSHGRLPLLKDTARDSALSPDALLAAGVSNAAAICAPRYRLRPRKRTSRIAWKTGFAPTSGMTNRAVHEEAVKAQ